MTSAIQRLLDEVSWEGNARKYRRGGVGLENVLTTEVFQALDFLPRQLFLGRVLRAAHGARAARLRVAEQAEDLVVDILAGDLGIEDPSVRVQPDVLLSSETAFVMVEAKRIQRSSFQTEQLARELVVTLAQASSRVPLLLLVLGGPPPVRVNGFGLCSIEEAVAAGMQSMGRRLPDLPGVVDSTIAFITWAEIADCVRLAEGAYATADGPIQRSISRIAASATSAVAVHG